MKAIGFKHLFVLICVSISLGAGCDKDNNDLKNKLSELDSIKDKLVGKWLEVSPCDSCHILTFNENDTIALNTQWDSPTLYTYYQIIAEDSIEVTRNWEIEQDKKTTKHKFIISRDRLSLQKFKPVDYGIIGFEDIILIKANEE